jgi:hypothetical protein
VSGSEHPLGLEHALLDGTDGNELAACGGAGLFGLHRRIATAHDDGIAEPDLVGCLVGHRNLRQTVECRRGVDHEFIDRREVPFALFTIRLTGGTSGLELGDGDEVLCM